MVTLDHVNRIDRDEWETTLVRDAMDTSVAARPSWTLRDAVATMEEEDVELLAVADANDNFVGIVSQADIVLLDEILDETGG